MTPFAPEDLAKYLKDLDFGADPLPLQRSLGLIWNLVSDNFGFQVSHEEKTFTKEASYQQFRASIIHWASWLPSQFKEKLSSENCHPKNMIGMILSHQTSECPESCGKSFPLN